MAVLVAAREKHNPSLPMVNDNYREGNPSEVETKMN